MDHKFGKGFTLGGKEGLTKSLYYLYKEYVLSLSFIIAGILIIVFVIFPQIQLWLELQKKVRTLQETNKILSENFSFLSALPESQVDAYVQTVGAALPIDKDFPAILNSISAASSKADIALGDYSFQVGELATKSAQVGIKRPSLVIDLTLGGDIHLVNNFVSELYSQLPLIEASEINYTSGSSNTTFDFYFKPFVPAQVDFERKISPLSAKEQADINTISQWDKRSTPLDSSSLLQ